ncbi:glycosyltransferase family 4 protein [Myroides odoratimimus]|uniref:glycosyltransferase family 4 protein n=1 Tax=Myroides odoratimimus TaxID=76832 RepID=UPI001CE13F0B|nr:glycosyltransferase family 4 protein [Myroides odoratimimus]MCA4793881.1 glycosyltransferase family 4 protein [Myroides odoratimimus]MCA4821141.1 glycosyltransferase family 4 protein [Myroides odoratimimus]
MKKLYIISELFYPNKTSTAYIMTELAKYFAGSYDVSVLTTDMAYDTNISGEDEKLSFTIHRAKVKQVDKNSFFSRVKGALGSSLVLTRSLWKQVKKGDKVLAVTNPFLIIFFLALIRRFKAFEYTLLVHDVFPENTIPAGLKKEGSISYKILKVFFDWSYRQADKVIVLGEDMKSLLVSKNVKSDKITVISNWYDLDLVFNPNIDVEEYTNKPSLNNIIVIGFAGNVGRVQGLDRFIKSFIKANNEKLCFVIIGEGAQLNELKELSKGQDNILFLGSKPREEQSIFLSIFDIGLVTLAKGMYGLGVPSKSYNLLHLGKPILYIGDSESEIDLMIKKYNCGWSTNWDNEEELVSLLRSISSFDKECYYSQNTQIARDYYSLHKVMNQFKRVVDGE